MGALVVADGFGDGEHMRRLTTGAVQLMLGLWAAAALLTGGILTSFHQPFVGPDTHGVGLAGSSAGARSGWGVVHVLSGSCACSQRVMRHLLTRKRMDGVAEQVVLVDGGEAYLAGSSLLAEQLAVAGFAVSRRRAADVTRQYGVRGVPLLLVISPERKLAYAGGYGERGDGDTRIVERLRAGTTAVTLPILGCAAGRALQAASDPFGWKYNK